MEIDFDDLVLGERDVFGLDRNHDRYIAVQDENGKIIKMEVKKWR